ncbi:MAG: 2-amino-4-hydroxy-6-hydroxymethyldihydropteridine diphosphokinase [Paludibacter sp.]
MAQVYLGLGTNLGNKEQNLLQAINIIKLEVGNLICQSSFYASMPWGFKSENEFLNAVIQIETTLTPTELLDKTQELELKLGRTAKTAIEFVDRLIDIDILLYDNIIVDLQQLKIPHQLLHLRDFVLIPLAEIAPDLIHPVFFKTIKELKTTNLKLSDK